MTAQNPASRTASAPQRAAIYARVSTQRQQKHSTIDSQVAELRTRVAEDGHQLLEEHVLLDDGYSGSYLDRPGLDRLRDLVYDRAIDQVYVHAPDRLARRYAHQVILIEELENRGCQMVFLHQPPSQDPEAELLVQIQGVIAEYERAKITERTRRGKLHLARQGVIVSWKAPYGYRYMERQGDEPGRWVIDETEAPAIRSLFGWMDEEGISIREATKRLNESPWKTRGGCDLWSSSTVGSMLKNESYAGTAYYNQRRWVESDRTDGVFRKGKKTRSILRPREEWIPIPIPALVEKETFDRVQKQLVKNKAFSRRNLRREEEYLLRCLVSCGVCGRAMTAHSYGRHTYYHCAGSVDHVSIARPRRCPTPQVYAPDLDRLVWEEISSLLLSPDRIRESWQRQNGRATKEATGPIEAELVRLDQRIVDTRQQIQRLVDGFQKGFLRASEVSTRRGSLEETLARCSTERDRLERERPRWRKIQKAWSSLSAFSERIAISIEALSFDARQKLLRKVIERVWITAWDVKVQLAIPLSTNLDLTTQRAYDPKDLAPLLSESPRVPRQARSRRLRNGSGAHDRGCGWGQKLPHRHGGGHPDGGRPVGMESSRACHRAEGWLGSRRLMGADTLHRTKAAELLFRSKVIAFLKATGARGRAPPS